MRRVVVAAIAVATAATIAGTSWSAPSGQATRVGCSGKTFTFLFWAQGHQAIDSVKFPAFPVPHLEAYVAGASYPNTNFLGFLGPDGAVQFARSCKPVEAPLIRARVASSVTTSDPTALTCSFKSAPQLDGIKLATGSRLLVIYPTKSAKRKAGIAAIAYIRPTGSSLTYDSRLCKPTPLPA